MKPDIKKRLIYALAGGALVPISYYFLLMILEKVSPSTLSWFGIWIVMPIAWPAYIHEYLFPPPAYSDSFYDFPGIEFWLYLLAANFILYSLLLYVGLWWKQRMPRLR